jgi:hypothetical protein
MFSLDNIVLPKVLESKLAFLKDYAVDFGYFGVHIGAKLDSILWLISAFILVLFFKSSSEHLKSFKLNYTTAIFTGMMLLAGIISLNKVSEFLYFNF